MFVNWRMVIRENVCLVFLSCTLLSPLSSFGWKSSGSISFFVLITPWNYYFVCDYLSVQLVPHSWHKGGRSILPEGKGKKSNRRTKWKCLKVKGRARLTSQKKILVSVAMLVTQSHKVLFLKASKKIIVHQLLDWCKSRWFYWLWWSYVDLYQMRIWPTVWRYFYFSSHSIS